MTPDQQLMCAKLAEHIFKTNQSEQDCVDWLNKVLTCKEWTEGRARSTGDKNFLLSLIGCYIRSEHFYVPPENVLQDAYFRFGFRIANMAKHDTHPVTIDTCYRIAPCAISCDQQTCGHWWCRNWGCKEMPCTHNPETKSPEAVERGEHGSEDFFRYAQEGVALANGIIGPMRTR
ncbi:MAG: hypothetical protein FWH26_01450 [Oscillospiraceae bacterium]|nr:hypothetical protein [Oscillospiraceae bacterium]